MKLSPTREHKLIALLIAMLIAVVIGIFAYRDVEPVSPVASPQSPESPTADASWVTYTDDANGISFKYPAELTTIYIRASEWPPTVSLSEEPYSCEPQASQGIETREVQIGGSSYCVTETGEGAAGSVYTEYTYRTEYSGRSLVLTFTLRSTQCQNYDEPQMQACTIEREGFDPDELAGQIDRTIEFK